ncbi:MAG: hypothetical protein E6R04_06005 [Spirochaetes bacterium]|nr:MAG: hypothetical protein E6R04_06005 [Spirochaetota bacterium]
MKQFAFRQDIKGLRGECRVYASGFPGVIRVEMFFACPREMRGSFEVSGPNVNAMACEMAEVVSKTTGAPMSDVGRTVRDAIMAKHDAWLEKYENNDD